MAEIIKFDDGTKLDVPASTVVGDALAEDLEDAVVIGWCRNGDFYLASSHRRYADTLWVLELGSRVRAEASTCWRSSAPVILATSRRPGQAPSR